jgi:hypothetical protein
MKSSYHLTAEMAYDLKSGRYEAGGGMFVVHWKLL